MTCVPNRLSAVKIFIKLLQKKVKFDVKSQKKTQKVLQFDVFGCIRVAERSHAGEKACLMAHKNPIFNLI